MDRTQAKVFILAMLLLGGLCVVDSAASWNDPHFFRLACFLAVGMVGATFKVVLPRMMGSLSINYILVLISVGQLSLPECMLVSLLSIFPQCFLRTRSRPRPIQVAFNLATIAIAVRAAYGIYHASLWQSQNLAVPVLLAMTSVGYFLANTIPVASIISLTESKSMVSVWKECYLWSFPFYLLGVLIAWGFDLSAARFGWQAAILTLPGGYIVYKTYRTYLARLEGEKDHAEKMGALHLRTIRALALAIDAKDHATNAHLNRVQYYALEVGREMKLSEPEMEALRAAAVLHDIGKLAVPENIISKPGRLTAEEFEKMKIHPLVGAEILNEVEFPYPVAPIVRSHHEKWDGSGYPDGLAGEQIPIGARILAAVDCLDALASDRQYRKAIPLQEAMQTVISEAGKSFDPGVVAILQKRYKELEATARQQSFEKKRSLSTNVRIERGLKPAAGFEIAAQSHSAAAPQTPSFVSSIAAAREEVQTLFDLSNDLGTSLSLTDMLTVVQVKLNKVVPHHSLAVYTLDGDSLVPEFAWGKDHELFSAVRIAMGSGLSGWVVQNANPIVNGNPAVDVETQQKSALSIPLESVDNGVIGALTLCHSDADAFTKDNLRILLALAPRIAKAVENAKQFSRARESATVDFLTGLPNARSLHAQLNAELQRCRREDSRLSVLVCDLNGFKQVNDTFGHLEGNHILKMVAKALKSSCREYDYVARLGGDEFVVVLSNMADWELKETAGRLRSAVSGLLGPNGKSAVSLSVGEATYPDVTTDADGLLAEADRRMYADKRRSKESVQGDLEQLAASLRESAVVTPVEVHSDSRLRGSL